MNPVWFILCVLVLVKAENGVTNKKCIDKDRRALLDFKTPLKDPYDDLSTWRVDDEENDCCKWSYVTCNSQTGHVTELALGYRDLEGEVSLSLLNLTYLTYLDLSGNSFKGTIPRSIGSLSQLRSLGLRGNFFNGTIPESIGSLTELTSLTLNDNYFSGTIPNSIGFLTKLSSLSLSRNSFNGPIPGSIGSLTQLTDLDLDGNSFNGTIPSEFGNLTNLLKLSLRNLKSCTIENIDWLSNMSNLDYLDMNGTSLAKVDNWVNVILTLRKLTTLIFEGCELSLVVHPYSSFSFVNSSSSIFYLYLGDNNLNSSMYRWLFPLTSNNLTELDLSRNKLDGIPGYFGNLCLRRLYMNDNSIAVRFSDFLNNLSGCMSDVLLDLEAKDNQLTGSLPDEIQTFSLNSLILSHNQLNGSINEIVWKLPTLSTLDLSSNSFRGAISLDVGKSQLSKINLSNNSLVEGVISEAHMSNLSYVGEIDLSSCKLGPHFPKWIQKLRYLSSLSIANTRISDTIPVDFWNTWPSQLLYLNLSSNNISGEAPDLLSNFRSISPIVDLSSNNFSGPILNISSALVMLDLSKNKFNGRISFLCQIIEGFLTVLDLSDNSFTGQIPDCLWHFKNLIVLNLGNNKLSGRIPPSVESLIGLEVLYLHNNLFSGELPSTLKNCTNLNFLYLGANKFSGNVPVWIGENLSRLYVLSLTSNNLFGAIPLQLCQLVNLQVLDLSMNNLNGTIPSCLDNLTAMVQQGFLQNQNVHHYTWSTPSGRSLVTQYSQYVDRAIINWQGNVREFSRTLGLVKFIDLSSNNLTGHIPLELADLYELLALNLSTNALDGEIPRKIGEMKKVLILDLSNNNLAGELPPSMALMTSLGYLDVSRNNLSGKIPSGTQLQSFEPSRYTGNAGLCGLPLTKYCPGDDKLQVPPAVGENDQSDGEYKDDTERWFYIGGASGFATGFSIVCSALLLNRHGRDAFSHFINSFKDCLYVR